MEYIDQELLEGVRNCYYYCEENFEETIRMVSSARDREPEEVKQALIRIRQQYADSETYQTIRAEIPADFQC